MSQRGYMGWGVLGWWEGGFLIPSGVSWVSGISWGEGSWGCVQLEFSAVLRCAWTRGITGSWSGGGLVLDFGWGFLGWRICTGWGGLGEVGR